MKELDGIASTSEDEINVLKLQNTSNIFVCNKQDNKSLKSHSKCKVTSSVKIGLLVC